ncbi:MAG: hypothetical protein A3B86_01060 [Candidatus Yanofskybacteria bacterium RIFCSPHIGHO2_02_FULL_38_22b]|uniref:Uncharacterized protein n=1 Tax=Candidatus Yanofskybacteria bacterium RIFCSPHIGHO2_02_FULL_38_22b TaxID=1802673 RepID=A0A1F8F2H6_9BACT|nr:MAG: hypothetical protein A3B86_01060 [Candidatus Yanofskybacteria bacterium RIFCSPHIGHO2_02_FULL_38_22b]OGN20382.1 MAG: hypothetical protein A2910_01410 [Candidatus Yanofskybacteria bacterium RIFCSPLOWO2_01_FULL_39_28]
MSQETNPIESRVEIFVMKRKDEYLLGEHNVNRAKFRLDIIRCAREQKVPVSTILVEFFSNDQFTKKEMGRFALNTSAKGDLVDGTVVLMHALGITAETVESKRILEDYIGVSTTDPLIWGASWVIDATMNWPLGTSLPSSRIQLAKI